jgi:opacity protein-like surface antigen
MFKKFLISSACLVAMTVGAVAADVGGPTGGAWYLRGDIGASFSRDYSVFGSDEAVAFGAGIGYQYSDMFRTDITFDGAVGYDLNFGVDLDTYSVLLNGYFDLPLNSFIKPYVGAGIGYGWAEASGGGASVDDDGFAFAGMAGVTVDLTQQMALDVGYKFRNISVSGQDVQDHMVRAGVRFYF